MNNISVNKKIIIIGLIIIIILLFNNIGNAAIGLLVKIPGKHYFMNSSNGEFVYLTGSHTWNNFQDKGDTDPPPAFDFSGHLNWLASYGHNFIRFWVFEQAKGGPYSNNLWIKPHPYRRTGPGNALEGNPKFNLNGFNQAYFDRLSSRIIKARNKGFYVSIMLFQGWSIDTTYGNKGNPWQGHPFNKNNNINGIDGDFYNQNGEGEEYHSTLNTTILNYQKAYIRKVIDSVNDLDNVLYEIANEDPGKDRFWAEKHKEWQYELVDYIKLYESTKPKQHPVGITTDPALGNDFVFNSNADWISPAHTGKNTCLDAPYKDNPPVPSTGKVVLLDTDHLWGIGGDRKWVWKSFLRGYNPIYMDHLKDTHVIKEGVTIDLIETRKNMGYTLSYAQKANISDMLPRNDLSSTEYCLAKEGEKYIIYQPSTNSSITIHKLPIGEYYVETLDAKDGSTKQVSSLQWNGGDYTLNKPKHASRDWVVLLRKK